MGRIVFWAGAVHGAACLRGVVDVEIDTAANLLISLIPWRACFALLIVFEILKVVC